MNHKKIFHLMKTSLLAVLAAAMVINVGEGFTSVMAHERELIADSPQQGTYIKELDKRQKNEETVVVGKREQVEREPQIDKEVEDYAPEQEVIKERTENTKTFQMQDGTMIVKQYFEPIHKMVNGQWEDIDDTLEKKNSLFRSYANEFENKDGILPITINAERIKVSDELEIIPEGDLSAFSVKENAVLYNHVKEGVDVQYDVRSNRLFQKVRLFDKDHGTFSFQIKTDKSIENKNGVLYVGENENHDPDYIISAPLLQDKDGKLCDQVETAIKKEQDVYEVTYTANAAFLAAEDTAYPVTLSSSSIRYENIKMDTAYIRSGTVNTTSSYAHLMVGFDKGGVVSGLDEIGRPDEIKIARSFFSFDFPKLPANTHVVSAYLELNKITNMTGEVPQIDVYDTKKKINANTVTWKNQPTDLDYNSSNANLKGVSKKKFNITKAAQKMHKGTPTSIMLRAANESDKYYMMAFTSESTGARPVLEVSYQLNYDFDPDMDVKNFDESFRYYTAGFNQFKGISMDGVAKPNSKVYFDLFEKTNNQETKVKTTSVNSDLYKVKPIFKSKPLSGVQSYTPRDVNYTSDYFTASFFPKWDTLYDFHITVTNGGKKSAQKVADSFIHYKVKLGDNLQTIATHYGVKVADLLKQNNSKEKIPKEGDVIFIDYPHENAYLSEDMYKPPIRVAIYTAEFKYRGPNCIGKCSIGDPVSVSTGNFYHESKDFKLSDYDELFMQRTYNSVGDPNASIFGLGFSSNVEQYLSYDKSGNILYYSDDGKILRFNKSGTSYQDDQNYAIVKASDAFTVENKDTGEKMQFNGYGMLSAIQTKTGKQTKLNYDAYGKLTSIDFGQKSVTLEYYPKRNLVKSITMPNGNKVQYIFNSNNQLIEFIDALGKSEKYEYNAAGKISSILNRDGEKIAQNTYDSKGRVLTQKDGEGQLTTFTYTAKDVIVNYAGGETKTYTYEEDYNVTAITNKDGTSTRYEYENGNLSPEIDGEGNKTLYDYDDEHQLLKKTYADATYETYQYDSRGNVLQHRQRDGKTESFQYDSNNNVSAKTDTEGLTTSFEYDDKGRVIKETNAKGASIQYNYSYNSDQIRSKKQSNGLLTSYNYDKAGNVILEETEKTSISYTYDENNQMLSKSTYCSPTTIKEYYAYDGKGNVIEYVDPLGAKTTYTYDANNNLVKTSKGTLTTTKSYDSLNRVISETDEQGLTKTYTYDAGGNIIKETDIHGNTINYTYDKANRKLSMSDVRGNITRYTYDLDNLMSETDALGNVTTYTYDDKNRVIEVKKPNGKTEKTEYDAKGDVVAKTNERGIKTTTSYDAFHRVIRETTETGIVVTYEYDAYDHVIKKNEDGRITTFTYDEYGNEITKTDPNGKTSEKAYDMNNRVYSEKNEDGKSVLYNYDAAGNVVWKIDEAGYMEQTKYDLYGNKIQEINANGYKTSYTYNTLGQMDTSTNAAGVKSEYFYDAYNQLIQVKMKDAIIQEKSYDQYGDLLEEKTLNEDKSYRYDGYGRVIEEKDLTSGLIISKTYDKFSNVIKERDNGGRVFDKKYTVYQELSSTKDAYGRTETSKYDLYGREIEKTSYEHETLKTTYDKYGNIITETNKYGQQTKKTYDKMNLMIQSVSPQGITTKYTYDVLGRNTSVWDSFTNKTSYSEYDAVGNVIKKIDQAGAITKYKYNGKKQMIEEENALGQITKTNYDQMDNVSSKTDADGNKQFMMYDNFQMLMVEFDEREFSTFYEYNDKLLLTRITDKNNKTIKKVYDEHNQIKEESNQNGDKISYEHDMYGNVTKETDAKGNITTTEYDVLGNITKISAPGKITIHTYNAYGKLLTTKENGVTTVNNTYDIYNQLTKTVDALGHVTTNVYDRYGNITKEDKEGYITEKSYDAKSQVTRMVENTDKITSYGYDVMGHQILVKQNDKSNTYTYDAVGNVSEKRENGVEQRFTYDHMNRIKQMILPNDSIYSYTYDATGNQLTETDPEGNVTTKTYTPMGLMESETDGNGNTTRYAYDGVGNIIKVQNALNRIVEFQYDGNSNLTKKYINSKQAVYQYDENNHLTSVKNEYGKTYQYKYDVDGHMLEQTKPDGTKIATTYDALGNKLSEGERTFTYDRHNNLITAAKDTWSKDTYAYDKYDRVQTVEQTNGKKVTYDWDIYGNKKKIAFGNDVIEYDYDINLAKVTNVKKNGTSIANYTYDDRGYVTNKTNGNYITNYSYDKLGRKIEYHTEHEHDYDLRINYAYTYDAVGNILSETIDGKKNTYQYDAMDELKKSKKFQNGEMIETTYGYDLYGNKTEASTNGKFKRYHYNLNNELTSISTEAGNTDIYYNANGSIRDINYAGGKQEHYEYDMYEQLLKLKNSEGMLYSFDYDAQGDRTAQIKAWNQRSVAQTWYEDIASLDSDDTKALLEDKDSKQTFDAIRYQIAHPKEDNKLTRDVTPGGDRHPEFIYYTLDKTLKDCEVIGTENGTNHIYADGERLQSEYHGGQSFDEGVTETVTYLNGNNNSVFEKEVSYPRSTISEKIEYSDSGYTDDITEGFGYNGEALDDSGLIYLRARYYNPEIGQFIQADSYEGEKEDIESQNRYAYAKQNPYKYIDKDGHMSIRLPLNPFPGVLVYPTKPPLKEDKKKPSTEKQQSQKIKNNNQKKKPETKANNVSKPKPKVEPCPPNTILRNSLFKVIGFEDKKFLIHLPMGGDGAGAMPTIINWYLDYRLYIDQYDTYEKIRVEAIAQLHMSYNSDLTDVTVSMDDLFIDNTNFDQPLDDFLKIGVMASRYDIIRYIVLVDDETRYSLNHEYLIKCGFHILPYYGLASASIYKWKEPIYHFDRTAFFGKDYTK